MKLAYCIASAIVAVSIVTASAGQTASGVQSASQPAATISPSVILQPALSEIQGSTSALNISKWKAPGRVKEAAQQDVQSIQQDLSSAVPGLLAQADAAPASVTPSFALYRNIDALYDVLLRISETADLAAPSNEAASLASCLQQLETARKTLGDSILQVSQRNDAEIASAKTALRSDRAERAKHKSEVIVDDGAVKAPATRTKRKTPRKKPALGTDASDSSK